MPEQTTQLLLKTIFSDVLSDLAFMFADEEQLDSSGDTAWLETTISYSGTRSGTLRLRCARPFALLLAANLLGIDPDDDDVDSSANDAVKEFMNILCGQFVTAAHGEEDAFDLTIPCISELDGPPDATEQTGVDSLVMTVEGQPVQFSYLPGQSVSVAAGGDRGLGEGE